MYQISVAVEVKENASAGSLIAIYDSETVVAPPDMGDQDLWIGVGETLERLGPDVLARAKRQVQGWTQAAGKV